MFSFDFNKMVAWLKTKWLIFIHFVCLAIVGTYSSGKFGVFTKPIGL